MNDRNFMQVSGFSLDWTRERGRGYVFLSKSGVFPSLLPVKQRAFSSAPFSGTMHTLGMEAAPSQNIEGRALTEGTFGRQSDHRGEDDSRNEE